MQSWASGVNTMGGAGAVEPEDSFHPHPHPLSWNERCKSWCCRRSKVTVPTWVIQRLKRTGITRSSRCVSSLHLMFQTINTLDSDMVLKSQLQPGFQETLPPCGPQVTCSLLLTPVTLLEYPQMTVSLSPCS